MHKKDIGHNKPPYLYNNFIKLNLITLFFTGSGIRSNFNWKLSNRCINDLSSIIQIVKDLCISDWYKPYLFPYIMIEFIFVSLL